MPQAEVHTVKTLLGVSELDLEAANGTDLPYNGWIEVDFKLMGTNHDYGIKVPVLVSRDSLDLPIIGYNVIEEITQNSTDGFSADKRLPYLDVLFSSMTLRFQRHLHLYQGGRESISKLTILPSTRLS